MAAIKTSPAASTDTSPVRYHVTDNAGNHAMLSQATVASATPNSPNAASSNVLVIQVGSSSVILSKQNATDLATAISNFGSSGTLS